MEKSVLIERIRNLTSENSLFSLFNDMKADYLGSEKYEFKPWHFRYFMNIGRGCCYRSFVIPKKSGGERTIRAPKGNLKWIHYCIKEIMESIYQPHTCVYGFVKGRSILDNANCHTNKAYVFNVDISNFFESVTEGMITTRLMRPPYSFNFKISEIIARLSCCCIDEWVHNPALQKTSCIHHYVLAQGSPAAPVLANVVCDDMDVVLAGLAARFGLTYTRYADDIIFSSDHNVYYADSDFRKELVRIIELFGFKVNNKKTRLQHRGQKQEVTGLTVNKGVNVSRKWYKEIRGLLHIWEKYGKHAALNSFYPRYHSTHGLSAHGEPDIEDIVYGKLCFLKMIIGENNPRYVRLREKFHRLSSQVYNCPESGKWVYLYTMPLKAFETVFHTKIIFNYSERLTVKHSLRIFPDGMPEEKIKDLPPRYYGEFEYNGVSFLVALSGKLQGRPIPGDAEISLCKSTGRSRWKYIYLLHRRHVGWNIEQTPVEEKAEDAPAEGNSPGLLAIAERMKAMFPELQLEIVGIDKPKS